MVKLVKLYQLRSADMTRKEAREYCFILMFEYEFQKNTAEELLSYFEDNDIKLGNQKNYIEGLLNTALKNLDKIDQLIEKYTKGWKINRLPKVTLSVLRVAICEIMYFDDIPDGIAINEAVELAKKYNDEKNGKFANGVLSSVSKGKLDE